MLSIQLLQNDLQLNTFIIIDAVQFISGEDVVLDMRLFQDDKQIRYIPESTAVLSMDFLGSDGNVAFTKTPTFTFAEDRSIIKVTLTAAETAQIPSQNLIVNIVESTGTKIAVLQNAFKKKVLNSGC